MYKKIMVYGMVIMLIMLCTPLPSYAADEYPYKLRVKTQITETIFWDIEYESNYPFKLNISGTSYDFLGFSKTRNRDYGSSTWTFFNRTSYTSVHNGPDFSKVQIVSCNHNLYSTTGDLNYDSSNIQQFEAKILTPWHDDYKDNGKTFAFQGMFRLPSDVQRSDVKITGTVDDSKDTYWINDQWRESYVTNTGSPNVKPYFSFNFALTVYDYGIHTYKLVFEQVSTGKKLGEVTRRFESLEGFIDENGDGLDDRTNMPPYTPLDPPGTNPGTSPEWDGTILGFFQYLIDSVKYYVQNIVDGINVTMGAIGKVPQIMGTILNFPEPLTALLIFGVTCTIILAIFRR